jgi:ParB-like chromosome segregation protein Spo0J
MSGSGGWREWSPEEEPIVRVAIADLRRSRSPRLGGEDREHIRALAESEADLPPIIVHRPTMRVIDGMHRLRAAELRSRDEIDVRFFDGDESAAFVLAVRANITHGLPLSLADRKAAASAILRAHPDWSDRLIATRTGLAAKTVGAMRDADPGTPTHPDSRVGKDGRVRPASTAEARKVAGELIDEHPDLSLRQVAREVGLSPETVRDVRSRLRRDQDPVPGPKTEDDTTTDTTPDHAEGTVAEPIEPVPPPELAAAVHLLRGDPALRLNGSGRALLKTLDANTLINARLDNILANVPPHCRTAVARAARGCARMWRSLATQLDETEDPA